MRKPYTVSDGKLVLHLRAAPEGGYVVTSPMEPELVTEAESIEEAFVNAVNARIGPAYKIEYYPAGQMLSFVEIMDGVRTGGAEMGAITPCFHSFDDPALGVSELPFLFNNNEAHMEGTKGLEPIYAEILESKFNQKLLNLHNYMGMALISKKQVKTLEDFDGLLIQAISPVFALIIEKLGAAPVTGTPYTEAYQLIEKGTIDGTIQAPSSMVSYALFDVAKYMTSAYLVSAVHGFTINLDVWNSLPADVQNAIAEEATKINSVIDEFVHNKYTQDHEDLLAEGVEIYYPEHSTVQTTFYETLAEKLVLLTTGGTDFHGDATWEM